MPWMDIKVIVLCITYLILERTTPDLQEALVLITY